jgi:hypothetical protein
MRSRFGSRSGSHDDGAGPVDGSERIQSAHERATTLLIRVFEVNPVCAAELQTHQWRSSTSRNAPLELRQWESS